METRMHEKTPHRNATVFSFVSRELSSDAREALFRYEIRFSDREPIPLTERIVFPEAASTDGIDPGLLDAALDAAHLMLGVSYYKLYVPPVIETARPLSPEQATFWNTVYRKGLGEFCYRNRIDPRHLAAFPFQGVVPVQGYDIRRKNRSLLGIGGGKDSIVAGEILKDNGEDFAGLLIETALGEPKGYDIADRVAVAMGVPTVRIGRFLDEMLASDLPGAYDGHVPVSGVFAVLGYLSALLLDYSYVIVGNEAGSSEGNVIREGSEVNHQWSKSVEFERLFQRYAGSFLSPGVVYFSLLRPWNEIRIAKRFARLPEYFPVFSSCNRTVRIRKERPEKLWCGECPKCVFVFLILSAFLPEETLVGIFGRNLFDDESLLSLFRDILGLGSMKPFDCVGTFSEARVAFSKAAPSYPESPVVRELGPLIGLARGAEAEVFGFQEADTLPERFRFMVAEKVLILGYGREGKVTERYLRGRFSSLRRGIADRNDGADYLAKQSEYDLAVKTPGIPPSLVTIPYLTATNLFFSEVRNPTVGVTGSKGKSTTASLIHAMLRAGGRESSLLGNIGRPMAEALLEPVGSGEILVLELSNYQLEDIRYSPDIAVVLNLFPEHLDRHGDAETYYEAKRNITAFQGRNDIFVYDDTDPRLREWAERTRAEKLPFSGIGVDGYETALQGEHNRRNVRAAVAVARRLGVSDDAVRSALRSFQPLRHRLECVGDHGGIRFYDDAISTTPESTIAALETVSDVDTIFLGGTDRGYDFSALEGVIRRKGVRNAVLFPESGKRMLSNRSGFRILETESMRDAVAFAFEYTAPGKACLLSTASPSYSLWKNFEEKGDLFQRLVREYRFRPASKDNSIKIGKI